MKFSISKKNARRRGERGAALLFAIGILAMLMMLGLGFVTNALIANRIASNNSRRSQARTLARAAVAQAMTQIMLYVDQANDPASLGANEYTRTLYDFGAIRSMNDTVSVNRGSSETSETLKDQLTGTDTKLRYGYDSGFDESGGKKYAFSATDASWVYFYDDTNAADKRIIGRAAWQVLPRHTRADSSPEIDDASRLSLFKMLAGAVGVGTGDTETSLSQNNDPDELLNERGKTPWLHRWGRGVEEMYLDLPGSVFSGWIANEDNSDAAPPYTFDMLFSANYDYFSSAPVTRRAWVRKWFSEGDQRLAKEAFAAESGGNVTYYHRFNLGDKTDGDLAWYDRFPSGGTEGSKNTAVIVDELAAAAQVFRERDTRDDKTNYYSGLPFLKRIGNDKWSFDTLENFRKQIAANLNDYCDDDDVPTSDVPAEDWSINAAESGKFPKYTGNEKTSYINEFAWVFDLPLKFNSGSGKFAGHAILPEITGANVAAAMFAELVNIYDADPASASYNLTARLEELTLSFALTVTYTVDLSVSYTNSDSSTGSTTATATHPASYTVTLAQPASGTGVSLDFGTAAAGYRIKGAKTSAALAVSGLPLASPSGALDTACANAAESAVPTGGLLSSWSVSSLQIAVRAEPTVSKFSMSPLLLKCSGKPVDFANFSTDAIGGAMTVNAAPGDTKYLSVNASASTAELPLRFVLGGFETVDPRQNLNPKIAENSDWYLKPTLFAAKVGGASVSSAGSGTIPTELSEVTAFPSMTYAADAAIDAVFTEGKVNTCSSPANSQIVVDGALSAADTTHEHSDTETVTDPAWNSGTSLSTAVIRNAPMKSLWELGAIHRAHPWQTLNLTGASNFVVSGAAGGNLTAGDMIPANFSNWTQTTGTDYGSGDGGILDMVKLSDACKAWGKLDVTQLTNAKINADDAAFSGMGALDKALVKALFHKINRGQTLTAFLACSKTATDPEITVGKISASDDHVTAFLTAVDALPAGALLRSQLLNTAYGESGSTCGLALTANDAQQEEIIGKTIGLLSANGRTIPNIFRILVIAQSIDDIGGFGTDIPVVKKDSGGNEHTIQCRQGVFNYCSATDQSGNSYNLYFDRITGEVKLVATVERDPETGSMKIRQLEYID